jgi:phosphoglycerate dehydrogenase-like enzyme
VDAAVLAAASELQVVGRAGVGLDNIDMAAADARGVVVVSPVGANALSVAEHAVGLAIALARGIVRSDRGIRRGEWSRDPGFELAGRTWGVLGAGATGRAVARLARLLGMEAIGYDPYAVAGDLRLASLDEVVTSSDVLSIHLPATATTQGMVDARLLESMRPGSLLVNVGRGEVVDEEALVAALHKGIPAGAALDVRASEPPEPGELERMDNVILTPHIAGITVESQARIGDVLVRDIRAVLSGGVAESAVRR